MRAVRILAALVMGLALATPAFATDPHGSTGGDVTQTQVNAPTTINAPVAAGGAGGSAVAIGEGGKGGAGGSAAVIGSGNSSSKSDSLAISGSSSRSSSKSGVKDSGNSSVVVDASTGEIPAQAPAVFAPNLTASPEACMGSVSFGGSAGFASISLGVSVGSTWKNHDCELRAFSREIATLPTNIATPVRIALLAQNDDVKRAFQDAGVEIPTRKVAAALAQPPVGVAYAPAPIVIQAGVQVEKRNVSLDSAAVTCRDGELKVKAGNGEYFCRAR